MSAAARPAGGSRFPALLPFPAASGRISLAAWLLAGILCGPSVASSAPETERRAAPVTATTARITIDGVLDEPAWHEAPGIGSLVQQQPGTGQPPTEATEVTLLFDQQNLYIGVLARDSQPARVIGTQMTRDADLAAEDRIEILLDTFHDHRNAFYFAINPAGALVDGLIIGNRQLNTNWDAIWTARTRRSDEGWSAEFSIPFNSLSFPNGHGAWGFNIARTIYRKLEQDRWAGARLEHTFLQVSEAGEITQLTGLTQGLGLHFRPFLAGGWQHTHADGASRSEATPGLDVFYNITPSLKLTGTVNTDFGETEADARQINLSRSALFFPEKRAFFLEDAGVFTFAGSGPDPAAGMPASGADVYPFFSRRIGLLDESEVPIDFGLKLAGKVHRTDLGLLGVHTDALPSVENKEFFVGRVRQSLFQQSYLGLLLTEGHPEPGRSGRTYGADLHLATSHFLGQPRNFIVDAYAVRSDNDGPQTDDWSFGLSLHYPNDRFEAQLTLRDIQKNFDPALGFVQRSNVRMYRIGASYNPRPRHFLNINQMFHDVYYTRFDRLDTGQLESRSLYITPLDWHFQSGDAIHAMVDVNDVYERLFEPFRIAPGVTLPVGEYRYRRYNANIASASKRRLFGRLIVGWGDYWSGTAGQLTAVLNYRWPPWTTLNIRAERTFARLPEGHFTARVVTANLAVAASPFLSIGNLVQYDNRSRKLGLQSRLRWTLRPGTDLFLAIQKGWIKDETSQDRFTASETTVAAKIQHSWRR